MTSQYISAREDAERAAQLAQELIRALSMALIAQDDNTEVVNIEAWKEAGVLGLLRTLQTFTGRVITRLERDSQK